MKKETGALKEKFKETNGFGETLHKKTLLKNNPKKLNNAKTLLFLIISYCLPLYLGASVNKLQTADGLIIGIDEIGRITSLKMGKKELLQPNQPGGFFISDVKNIAAQEIELLDNPSFEQLQDNKPIGWTVGNDWTVDHQTAHSGKVSMKVHIPESEKRSSGQLAVQIPVKPNTPYRVSMWIRTKGGAPHFYIVQIDEQGNTRPSHPQICVTHNKHYSDWFYLSQAFTTSFFCHKIKVYTNLWQQTGTAWIDDVSVVCLKDDYISPQKLITGKIRKTKEGLEHISEVSELSLKFKSFYKSTRNYIAVNAEVEDISNKDRAITISFRLPIDALNWTWFDDIHNQQVIKDDVCYGKARVADEEGRRTISIYPFSAMGNGKVAVSLAIPMDMPRVFRICYDRKFGFFLNYEFGLSTETKKFPKKAWFKFFIYRIDPKWGFRSAAKRYYDFFPQFFVKRVEREGPAGFMPEREIIESPNYITSMFNVFDYWKRDTIPIYKCELAKMFSYTEFTMGWWGWALGITKEQAKRQPTPEEAWKYVEKLAHNNLQNPGPRKVAECILNCNPYDSDGNRRLHYRYVPEWGGYNYLCNPDPEIEGINRYKLTYEREVPLIDTYKLDGMYYDSASPYRVDNFRTEHFKWTDHPLAFDHITKKPVIPMDFSVYECTKAISDDIHNRGLLILSNYSATDHPTDMFRIQFIDIIGNEMLFTWTTDKKFALQRTLAYQKTISMSWQEAKKEWPPEKIEKEIKQAMFYGTFYSLTSTTPQMKETIERWEPLTKRLANAGWEPIPYAESSEPLIMVERFGNTSKNNLHFTLRNDTNEAKSFELSINLKTIRLRDKNLWQMDDSYTYKKLNVKRSKQRWIVNLTVPANDTLVLRIANKSGLALDYLFLVPEWLQKAINYRNTLKTVGIEVKSPDYEQILKQVEEVIKLLRLSQVDTKKVLIKMELLTEMFNQPIISGDIENYKGLVTRLKDYTMKAQSKISNARDIFLQR